MGRSPVLVALAVLIVALGLPASVAAAETDARAESVGASTQPALRRLDPRRIAREKGVQRRALSEREATLIERPDRKRPQRQLSLPVFGRPLTIGGRYTALILYEEDRLSRFDFLTLDSSDLDGDGNRSELKDAARGRFPEDDRLRVDTSLQLDVFYPFLPNASIYVSGRGAWRNRVKADHAPERSDWVLARNESWLYLGSLLETPLGLQIGQQRFADEREWWWDQNLDALRVRFDRERFHAEASVAQQLFAEATNADGIDPEQEDVLRFLGSAQWEWASKQRIGLYLLHQDDSSSPLPQGACVRSLPPNFQPSPFFTAGCIDPNREDESDADLTWFGISAAGRRRLGRAGALHYWLNAAGVVGDETFYDVTGPTNERRVGSVNHNDVRGWGIDVWATWQTKIAARPRLTLGYAFGSGERNAVKQQDTGFRQTGLQDNNDKLLGVDSFRYYGELVDPELSNLHIVTAGLGFRLLRESSIELLYHYYRQAHAAPFLRDVGFKRDPDGRHRSIGQELDVVLGLEDWDPFEIEIIGALFRTGAAFAPDENHLSSLGILQVRLNF